MLENAWTPSKELLSPGDLEVLETFLAAWCEENRVHRNDAAAEDIASALIHWYQRDPRSRSRVHLKSMDELPLSPEIETLLRQIT